MTSEILIVLTSDSDAKSMRHPPRSSGEKKLLTIGLRKEKSVRIHVALRGALALT